MGELILLFALVFAVAWSCPAIDMEGERAFDDRTFWFAVLIGLLATAGFHAARAVWRRSTRG